MSDTNSKMQIRWLNALWVVVLLILIIEIAIDVQTDGDFQGYVNAGALVMASEDIYSDYLNTWPPLFSIFPNP